MIPSARVQSLNPSFSHLGGQPVLKNRICQVEERLLQECRNFLLEPDVVSALDGVRPLLHVLSTEPAGLKTVQDLDHMSSLKGDEFFLAVPSDASELLQNSVQRPIQLQK